MDFILNSGETVTPCSTGLVPSFFLENVSTALQPASAVLKQLVVEIKSRARALIYQSVFGTARKSHHDKHVCVM